MSGQYTRYPVVSGGGGGGIAKYANFAALPAVASNGDVAVTLDTDTLYVYDGAMWVPIGGTGVPLAIGTIDSQTASVNGAVIASNALVMQSATASRPGLMNTGTQSFAGNKTFLGSVFETNVFGLAGVGAAGGNLTLTSGAGASGFDSGDLSLVTPSAVSGAASGDILFTTGNASGGAAGNILFEAGDGNSVGRYGFKTVNFTAHGYLDFQSLTSDRTYTFPDADGTIALTSNLQVPGGNDTSLQYNAAGTFGGINQITWDFGGQQLNVNALLQVTPLTDSSNGINFVYPGTQISPLLTFTRDASVLATVSPNGNAEFQTMTLLGLNGQSGGPIQIGADLIPTLGSVYNIGDVSNPYTSGSFNTVNFITLAGQGVSAAITNLTTLDVDLIRDIGGGPVFDFGSGAVVQTDLYPDTDITQDLGKPANRFKTLYTGGASFNFTGVSGTYAAFVTDYFIGVFTASPYTITLVDATTVAPGTVQIVKDISGTANVNNITIDAASGLIDGNSTTSIDVEYGCIRAFTDGSNWFTF